MPNLPKHKNNTQIQMTVSKIYSIDVPTVVDVLIDVQTVVNKFQVPKL